MSTCRSPTPFEKLVALWAGDLAGEEAAALEEHLFGCDDCSAASDRLGALVSGIRDGMPPVISHRHRDRLVASGMRLLETIVEAGVDATARFSPDVDLLVHVLRADLADADRVDVEVVGQDGATRVHLEHVPFDRSAGEVLLTCQRHYREAFPEELVFRVFAVESGERRAVGDYFIEHIWE